MADWGKALQMTFYNRKGEILLQEIPNGGARQKKARHFKSLPGGGYRLKASFVSNPGEKIYGCGQYQQEVMDLKGCSLELATGAENEIWSYGEENYEIMVKFIRIREMMRDYIRGLMREAHETGSPVMRAMFYEFPEDENCWDIRDAYMFGPDILVAPICHEKARKRSVYLPSGTFFLHAGTGERYEGGKWYEVEAALDTLPVFLREGRQEYLAGQI